MNNQIYLSVSQIHGRGVFTKSVIKSGDIIENCPIIEVPTNQIRILRETILINYYFMWGDDLSAGAIALGYGSIYNHSYEPNATFEIKIKEQIIDIKAIKDISQNEEITINYNGEPSDKSILSEHYNII